MKGRVFADAAYTGQGSLSPPEQASAFHARPKCSSTCRKALPLHAGQYGQACQSKRGNCQHEGEPSCSNPTETPLLRARPRNPPPSALPAGALQHSTPTLKKPAHSTRMRGSGRLTSGRLDQLLHLQHLHVHRDVPKGVPQRAQCGLHLRQQRRRFWVCCALLLVQYPHV